MLTLFIFIIISGCSKPADTIDKHKYLRNYLTSVGYHGDFIVRVHEDIDDNVISLITFDKFFKDPQKAAELIIENECYGIIASQMRYSLPEKSVYKDKMENYGLSYDVLQTFGWVMILLDKVSLPEEYTWLWDAYDEIAANSNGFLSVEFASIMLF
jgi:hypothetical protein